MSEDAKKVNTPLVDEDGNLVRGSIPIPGATPAGSSKPPTGAKPKGRLRFAKASPYPDGHSRISWDLMELFSSLTPERREELGMEDGQQIEELAKQMHCDPNETIFWMRFAYSLFVWRRDGEPRGNQKWDLPARYLLALRARFLMDEGRAAKVDDALTYLSSDGEGAYAVGFDRLRRLYYDEESKLPRDLVKLKTQYQVANELAEENGTP